MSHFKYDDIVKPINSYVDLAAIYYEVKNMNINDVLSALCHYDIVAWNLNTTWIYIVEDPETRAHNYLRASTLALPDRALYDVKTALEFKLKVKILREDELRAILRGIMIHEIYKHFLRAIPNVRVEEPVKDEELKVAGRVDILCPDFLIEIKTSRRMLKAHVYQTGLYMLMAKRDKAYVVYPRHVLKLNMTSHLKKGVVRRLTIIRNLYRQVQELTLEEILHEFDSHLFEQKFKMKPEDLIKLLNQGGFIK